MNRKFTILVMITTMLLLIFVTVGLAKPVGRDYGKIEWTDYIWNECTLESIEFEGTWHWNYQEVKDATGESHYKWHDNYHLVGVASDGTKYIANDEWNSQGDYPYTNDIRTIRLISKGKETNFILQIRFHKTINANGEVTADFDKVKIICTGEKP